MAKLTHEQRCSIEEYGDTGKFNMKDETKVVLDYKILTSSIKKELLDILKFSLSDTANKMNWRDKKFSSNQHFLYQGESIYLVTCFNSHRLDHLRTDANIALLRNTTDAITTYPQPYNQTNVFNKLRQAIHTYLEDVVGFEKNQYYSKEYNNNYYKFQTIDSDLRYIIGGVIAPSSKINIDRYTLPGKPYNLQKSINEGRVTYNYNGRLIEMKSGKGIRKFFKMNGQTLNDNNIKDISNRLNLKVSDFKLKVVEGTDIDKYYSYTHYDESFDTGSLSSSCMRGDDAQDNNWFEVYKENAKMLILINEESDLIIGRAILWDNAEYVGGDESIILSEGFTKDKNVLIMDRIYSSESVYSLFKDWALENGYYRKRYQSYNNPILWKSPFTKDEVELEFNLPINLNDYEWVPYMDTFAWGDENKTTNEEDFGYFTARSTEGILEGGDNEYYDDYCDDEDESW